MARRGNPDLDIVLVVMGDDECGVENLVGAFVGKGVPKLSFYDYPYVTRKNICQDGKTVGLQIRIPMPKSQLRFMDTTLLYNPLRGYFHGAIIVYDVCNVASFEYAKYLIWQIMDMNSDAKISIVGNILHVMSERTVSYQQGKGLAEMIGAKYLEVKADDYVSAEEVFHTIARDAVQDIFPRRETILMEALEIQDLHFVKREETSTKQSGFLRRLLNPIFGSSQEASGMSSVPDELKLDPYTLDLYEKALKDGVEKDRTIRLNVVGNYKQGKTSLTKRLLGQKVRDITSTNGIDIEHYICHKTDDGKFRYQKADDTCSDIVGRLVSVAINKEIKNKHADEKQQQLSSNLALSHGFASTYRQHSSHNMKTRDQLLDFSAEAKVTNRNEIDTEANSDFMCSINSNNQKGDASEKTETSQKVAVLSEKEISSFTKALNKTTPPSKTNLPTVFDVWDFGGQYIFYATHTIFHSSRAIYLLVFDLSLDLKTIVVDDEFPSESNNRNMEYFIKFWMQSIHSFVGSADGTEPKVILVGTHRDKIKGSSEQKQTYIKGYFDDVRQLFDGTKLLNHLHPEDFAVDNTDAKDASVMALKKTIGRLANEKTHILKVPAKWIQLERNLKERKHMKILSIDFLMAIDGENEFPLGDLEQVKLFLRYHHRKGTFVYFDEEPISNYVVLDPQYLVDAFKTILTSERFCSTDPEIRPAWKKLLTDARLGECLIDRQWGKVENKAKLFLEYKEILLAFLTKHHIISEATEFDEAEKTSRGLGWYVVPSLLRNHPEEADMQLFLQGKRQTHIRLVMSFENSQIVPTIYHRYIAAVIAKWPIVNTGRKSLIFTDLCVVRLDVNHAGILEMQSNGIELRVASLCPSLNVDSKKADIFRRYSETVIVHEFEKLRDNVGDFQPFTLRYRCNHDSHGDNGSVNTESLSELDDKKLVACPDLSAHDLYADKAKSEWFQDHCRNPIPVPKHHLKDKLLSKLSQCIGENWQLLGYELGLKQVQIEHIEEDHQKTCMKIYNMLKEWCIQMPKTATLDVLVQAMQNCASLSVDWDGLRNIADGCKTDIQVTGRDFLGYLKLADIL